MNLPIQSPSIDRRTIFAPALLLITEPEVSDPSKFKSQYELVEGTEEYPNSPMRYRPAPCAQECSIFSGLSLISCLAGCKR